MRSSESILTNGLGTLTMFLDKEAYERAGLAGKPQGVKGKRGLKPRWGTLPGISRAYALANSTSR